MNEVRVYIRYLVFIINIWCLVRACKERDINHVRRMITCWQHYILSKIIPLAEVTIKWIWDLHVFQTRKGIGIEIKTTLMKFTKIHEVWEFPNSYGST